MKNSTPNLISDELREFRPAFAGLILFSLIITLMYLVPSLFMQQIYERVMQSRSYATLTVLCGMVIFLTVIWTAIEVVRMKVLQRIAFALDEKISTVVFDALNRQTGTMNAMSRGLVLQDLNVLRDFIGGPLVIQFLDFLGVPLIIAAAFLFHPILGLALVAVTSLVALFAYLSQALARKDTLNSLTASGQAADLGRSVMQTAETVRVLGMLPALTRRWRNRQRDAIGWQQHAAKRVSVFVDALRFLRHLYLPLMLVVGTILFLREEVGPGVIFGAAILVGRAVGPVDAIANSWRVYWNASMSSRRINEMLNEAERRQNKVSLPEPDGPLHVSRVMATPRNRDLAVLNDISFRAEPGQVIGVVGPSGAGKSSLARVLIGAWPLARGSISLDGHEIAHWDQDELGKLIGYVPQDVDLLPGTVAENIARFDTLDGDTSRKIIEAVKMAGVEDIVGKLADGLNTRLGPDGHVLSSGQRQRIALARAVYGSPRLIVLDEPNSNLDAAGEERLARTISDLRRTRAIVVLITHRLNMLSICDNVLVLNGGAVQAYGTRAEVLDRLNAYRPKEITSRTSSRTGPGSSVAA
jgi:ATP-binding cassette, subfamily C, bacterial exporter for protease/lipase